jgi:hypothetical protein
MPMPTIRLSNVVMVGESYQSDRVGTMTRKTQLRRIERGRPAARPQLPPPANAMPLEQHRTGYPPARARALCLRLAAWELHSIDNSLFRSSEQKVPVA